MLLNDICQRSLAAVSCFTADVGRSCIIITLGGKNIMLDCGMHMGYNDEVSDLSPGKLMKTSKRIGKSVFIHRAIKSFTTNTLYVE